LGSGGLEERDLEATGFGVSCYDQTWAKVRGVRFKRNEITSFKRYGNRKAIGLLTFLNSIAGANNDKLHKMQALYPITTTNEGPL